MSLAFLIDGYNLIHALGLVHKQLAPKELENARRRLLEFLHERLEALSGDITVVFDAKHKPRHVPSEYSDGQILVRYAGRNLEADDVIEELIASCSIPERLVVVSDDRRLRDAAARRRAQAWSTQDLLDHSDQRSKNAPQKAPPPGVAPLSRAEVREWMDEFADVEMPNEYRDFLDPPPSSE
jgi:uncharacterized protein